MENIKIDNSKAYILFQKKENGKFIDSYYNDNETTVYRDLSIELIAKNINKCNYIRSIKRTQLYTGFINITVNYYDHMGGGRRIYHIREH